MLIETRQGLMRFRSAMEMYKKYLLKILPEGEIIPAAVDDMILEADMEIQGMDMDDPSALIAP